jgi:hypothetical protein
VSPRRLLRLARRLPWRLAGDTRGVAAVESAVVLPVMILMLIGTIELSIVIFMGSSIEAAILEASRYGSTGTTGASVSRQQRVLDILADKTYGLVDMDEVELETLVYESFADIGQPEPFVDDDGNGVYTLGESFTDINGNGQWDDDMGAAGLGGPSDVVVYRVEYAWGIMSLLAQSVLGDSFRHVSSIAVRNEPF